MTHIPHVAYDLLSKIPRLEPIAWMIQHQNRPLRARGPATLRRQTCGGERKYSAWSWLTKNSSTRGLREPRRHTLWPARTRTSVAEFFHALVDLDPNAEEGEIRKCRIERAYARHDRSTRSSHPRWSVARLQRSRGHSPAHLKLKNFHARRAIAGDVTSLCPPPHSLS